MSILETFQIKIRKKSIFRIICLSLEWYEINAIFKYPHTFSAQNKRIMAYINCVIFTGDRDLFGEFVIWNWGRQEQVKMSRK